MNSLSTFLKASQARHSYLCPRQVLGVRIALAALSLLDKGPSLKRQRNLMVISETNGCFVAGIEVTAQVSAGHRSLQIENYGKIAATFIDTKTGQAVRLHPVNRVRELARSYYPNEKQAYFAQLKGYQIIPDSELLHVEWVKLNQDVRKIVGSPKQRAHCNRCGEEIINGREIVESNITMCKACAGDAYYRLQDDHETMKIKNTPEGMSPYLCPVADLFRTTLFPKIKGKYNAKGLLIQEFN